MTLGIVWAGRAMLRRLRPGAVEVVHARRTIPWAGGGSERRNGKEDLVHTIPRGMTHLNQATDFKASQEDISVQRPESGLDRTTTNHEQAVAAHWSSILALPIRQCSTDWLQTRGCIYCNVSRPVHLPALSIFRSCQAMNSSQARGTTDALAIHPYVTRCLS